jgi:hypothetical protein
MGSNRLQKSSISQNIAMNQRIETLRCQGDAWWNQQTAGSAVVSIAFAYPELTARRLLAGLEMLLRITVRLLNLRRGL